MKYVCFLSIFFLLASCSASDDGPDYSDFRDVTSIVSVGEFESIKSHILAKGDYVAYSNMYQSNPHFAFSGFDCYLNPEVGQINVTCNPDSSDFNMLVIQDFSTQYKYLRILMVRRGDLDNPYIAGILPGMKERKVYLINDYDKDLAFQEKELEDYLSAILEEVE
ncbi:MAG: hypothetical protein JW801_14575 [Bacteroidales bacterium]|nr:hypothetical protein [Bacteroidales bacterium]